MPAKEVDAARSTARPDRISDFGVPFVVSSSDALRSRQEPMKVVVVVVASGQLEANDAGWLDDADLVIAADGGAGSLDRLERRPDLLIGDLDSIDPALVGRLAASGTPIDRRPADKEASDTELAVDAALAAGATEVVILGAMGGERLDHELANLLLLADPALARHGVRAVRGPTTVRGLHAGVRLELAGVVGDLVTLLPVGGAASGVTTDGLRWPLEAATLAMGRSRGLSNEIVSTPASVRVDAGALLVVETARERRDP
jgi:thiamine pyrophosphokinase